MSNVIIHEHCNQNLRELKRNEYADCAKCMMSEKSRMFPEDNCYTCKAALFDTNTYACFVPKDTPAVDAEPVKHGYWIEKPYLLGTTRYCSICDQNYGMPHGVFNFCPNCGAKMDGERKDNV